MYEVARLRSWSRRPAYVTIDIYFLYYPQNGTTISVTSRNSKCLVTCGATLNIIKYMIWEMLTRDKDIKEW